MIPLENTESTICLLTDRMLKAGGHLKADNVFWIKNGACSVVEDIALHSERDFGHVPKCAAYALWTCGGRLWL